MEIYFTLAGTTRQQAGKTFLPPANRSASRSDWMFFPCGLGFKGWAEIFKYAPSVFHSCVGFERSENSTNQSSSIIEAGLISSFFLLLTILRPSLLFSSVYFIMRTDIKKGYLFFSYDDRQRYSIFVSYAYGLNAFEPSAETMVFQVGLKRVFFEIAQDTGKFCSQFRMVLFELFCCACEVSSQH